MQVYKIKNTITGRVYIGATSVCLRARLKQHSYAATAIGRAIRSHGISAFTIESIFKAKNKKELNQREQEEIMKHKKHSYNAKPKDLLNTEIKVVNRQVHIIDGHEINLSNEWEQLYRRESLKGKQRILAFLYQVKTEFLLLRNVISHQVVQP